MTRCDIRTASLTRAAEQQWPTHPVTGLLLNHPLRQSTTGRQRNVQPPKVWVLWGRREEAEGDAAPAMLFCPGPDRSISVSGTNSYLVDCDAAAGSARTSRPAPLRHLPRPRGQIREQQLFQTFPTLLTELSDSASGCPQPSSTWC